MSDPSVAGLPGAVLFACNFNRVRSPMAAGLMRLIYGDRIFVDDCGLRPGEQVDPFVLLVMEELGVDLGAHQAKSFAELADGSFDIVVSLTPESEAEALALARGRSMTVEYWPTDDPTHAEGSREARLGAYRAVRDALKTQILRRFGDPSTMGG